MGCGRRVLDGLGRRPRGQPIVDGLGCAVCEGSRTLDYCYACASNTGTNDAHGTGEVGLPCELLVPNSFVCMLPSLCLVLCTRSLHLQLGLWQAMKAEVEVAQDDVLHAFCVSEVLALTTSDWVFRRLFAPSTQYKASWGGPARELQLKGRRD